MCGADLLWTPPAAPVASAPPGPPGDGLGNRPAQSGAAHPTVLTGAPRIGQTCPLPPGPVFCLHSTWCGPVCPGGVGGGPDARPVRSPVPGGGCPLCAAGFAQHVPPLVLADRKGVRGILTKGSRAFLRE